MATLPEGTRPIPNPLGTAPAVQATIGETALFLLPGVPEEMKAIFEEWISPLLRQASRGISLHEKSMYVDKLIESNLAPIIDKVMHDNPGVYIKSHPRSRENHPHIEIHFSIKARSSDRPEKRISRAADQFEQLVIENGGKVSDQP
jgi:molybdopterin-biosynthesis enzyme MoeA-like protein